MQWLIALSVGGNCWVWTRPSRHLWPFGVLLRTGRLDGGGLSMVVRIGWL